MPTMRFEHCRSVRRFPPTYLDPPALIHITPKDLTPILAPFQLQLRALPWLLLALVASCPCAHMISVPSTPNVLPGSAIHAEGPLAARCRNPAPQLARHRAISGRSGLVFQNGEFTKYAEQAERPSLLLPYTHRSVLWMPARAPKAARCVPNIIPPAAGEFTSNQRRRG